MTLREFTNAHLLPPRKHDRCGRDRAPAVLVMLSGKRLVGKDAVADELIAQCGRAGVTARRLTLVDCCKVGYAAETAGVELQRLLGDREYKEAHRTSMTRWFHETIAKDVEAFRRIVATQIKEDGGCTRVFVISDARLLRDFSFFESSERGWAGGALWQPPLKLRIEASDEARKERGWEPNATQDTDATECELDDYSQWTKVLRNDGSDRGGLARLVEAELLPLCRDITTDGSGGGGGPREVAYLAQHPLFDQIPALWALVRVFPWVRAGGSAGLRHANVWLGEGGTITALHFDSCACHVPTDQCSPT
jgi:phosphomevalonate kinase